ncbi:BON domain-containing protein [Aeromicrobium sp. A1-2]|uniref:BON domain-containing protein n=1 Tax=Aeromicrobium sp. A1-2 TaxID=2107713 RepID=UPI0013C3108B|nr:BON domain-containing protein [Aeromicrobium sp. A1-2]
MPAPTFFTTDHDVQKAVTEELDWTPQVHAENVGVSVHQGVATLSGDVRTLAERTAAAKAALSVHGVIAIANELTVHLVGAAHTDSDVAEAVSNSLRWSSVVPAGQVRAEVKDHVVTLTGLVDWDYQRHSAHRLVEHIDGVAHVENHILLKERPTAHGTEALVRRAVVRKATRDANSITATVDGTNVTLKGTVTSWSEKQQAGHAAWSSPHVTSVTNQIRIVVS